MSRSKLLGVLWLGAALAIGCGGGDSGGGGGGGGGSPDGGGGGSDPDAGGGGGPDGGSAAARYFPLAVGATWSYQVVDSGTGTSSIKSQTVEAYEDVGGTKAGTMAFRLRTEKTGGYTLSWQEDVGDGVVRHREESHATGGALESTELYAPSKLRIDEAAAHLAMSAAWDEVYMETTNDLVAGTGTLSSSKTDHWTVEAIAESVTVPAGTFDCVKLHRTNAVTGSDKRFWFAPGVGKIKEVGGGQTEQLESYDLP